ncbi:MAG: glycosyltransferase [Gammaproteobacteria bacterium]|nr:glycosyltransferase [Gammaproteobacteria bacterium]
MPDKIENIRQLKEQLPSLEVYAYSDASTDATNDLLLNAADILHPVISAERLGKVSGMHKLISMIDSDIIIFTDANVILEPKSLPVLINYFTDPDIGCVSGRLMYKEMHSSTAKVGGVYWKLEEFIKSLETKTGSTMGCDGAIFARRRKGYPEIPPNLVDDMAVSMATIFDNKRCISAPEVIAYENAVTCSAEEFNRKKRIACGSYSTYLFQKSALKNMSITNRFKFISHKLLRWWGALFIIGAIFSFLMWGFSIGSGWLLLITVISVITVFTLAGRAGVPGISQIYEIVIAIFATGLGVIEALTGKEYKTWDTANSR